MDQLNQIIGKQPVVAITGSSMGLGYALAEELLKQGFSVSLCARNEKRLQNAIQSLSSHGSVTGWPGDVSDPYFRKAFIQRTVNHYGRLDALVNNASSLGDLPMPNLDHTSASNLRRVYEINTFAPILLNQEALPHMIQKSCAISIAISSDAAIAAYPGWGVYGGSKAALDLSYKTLAAEQAYESVLFYLVDPGDMQTEMHEAASPGDDGLQSPKDVAKNLSEILMPLQNLKTPTFPSGSYLEILEGHLRLKGGN